MSKPFNGLVDAKCADTSGTKVFWEPVVVSSVDSITEYYLNSVVGTILQNGIATQLAELANNRSLLIGSTLYSKDADGNLTAASMPSSSVYEPLYSPSSALAKDTTQKSPSPVPLLLRRFPVINTNPSVKDSILEIQRNPASATPTIAPLANSKPSNQLDLFIQGQSPMSASPATPQVLPLG